MNDAKAELEYLIWCNEQDGLSRDEAEAAAKAELGRREAEALALLKLINYLHTYSRDAA